MTPSYFAGHMGDDQFMRRRIIAIVLGGLIGTASSAFLDEYLGMSAVMGILTCAVGGIVLAYVCSMLFDVFTGLAEPSQDA